MTNSLSELENEILGTILIRPGAIREIRSLLPHEDIFRNETNRKIYAVMLALSDDNKETDIITVNYYLVQRFGSTIGKMTTMQILTSFHPYAKRATGNLLHKCTLLHQEFLRITFAEKLAQTLTDIQDVTYDPFKLIDDVSEWISKTMSSLYELSDTPFSDTLKQIAIDARKAALNRNPITGVPTLLSELDDIIKGLQDSTLTVLAGRPGSGKTAEACQIAYNVAVTQGIPVAFFSLEMNKRQVGTRLLAIDTAIKNSHITAGVDGWGDSINFDRLDIGAENIGKTKLFVYDKFRSLPQIKNKVNQLVSKYGKILVIIDYLQLVRTGTSLDNNPTTRVSEVSNQLKALSTDNDIPVLTLAQLNRSVETREGNIPQISDLKMSGSIEEDADNIIFLYRPGYYSKTNADGSAVDMNLLVNIVAKCRQGPTHSDGEGTQLHYNLGTNQIKNWPDLREELLLD